MLQAAPSGRAPASCKRRQPSNAPSPYSWGIVFTVKLGACGWLRMWHIGTSAALLLAGGQSQAAKQHRTLAGAVWWLQCMDCCDCTYGLLYSMPASPATFDLHVELAAGSHLCGCQHCHCPCSLVQLPAAQLLHCLHVDNCSSARPNLNACFQRVQLAPVETESHAYATARHRVYQKHPIHNVVPSAASMHRTTMYLL